MSDKSWRSWTACSGILGMGALVVYFSAPFWLMPLPPPDSPIEQLMTFGKEYHKIILLDVSLQQIGSLLSVVFALSLVHMAGASDSFAGKLTLLASGVILALSLAEGTFVLATVRATEHGQSQAAMTCFGLTFVFIHIFLLAPSLFLVMGFALSGKSLLPKFFSRSAIVLGILFQILGIVGLFINTAVLVVIFVLMAQNLWSLAASILLLQKSNTFSVKNK